jgi:hypothetical protein
MMGLPGRPCVNFPNYDKRLPVLSTDRSVGVAGGTPVFEESASSIIVPGQTSDYTKLTTAQILLNDAEGYWRFDDTSSPFDDSSGNGLGWPISDGTPVSTTTNAKFTRSLDFDSGDGINQSVGTGVLYPGSGDFTVCCWVRTETAQGGGPMRGYRNETLNMCWGIRWSTSFFRFWISRDGSGRQEVNFGSSFSLNTWYFLLCWKDASANRIYIDVNNSGSPSHGNITAGALYNAVADFQIRDYFDSYTEGQIDGVGYWNRQLTTTEKNYLASNQL